LLNFTVSLISIGIDSHAFYIFGSKTETMPIFGRRQTQQETPSDAEPSSGPNRTPNMPEENQLHGAVNESHGYEIRKVKKRKLIKTIELETFI
jgi:hypothetical protein